MHSIRWTIWLLLAFVLIATVDSQPDPPAVNPSSALCKVLQPDCSCAPVTPCNSVVTCDPFPISFVAADAFEPFRPTDRMILTVHAADTSPPHC
jgi:hypothetical protein